MGLLATAKGLQIKGLTENEDSDTPPPPKEERSTPVRSINRGPSASTSNSGVKRPQSSQKNTSVPAPKKIKEETVAVEPPVAVHEDTDDYSAQNPDYLDDTEELADYSMEDNPGESMVYEGDPNNPGVSTPL